MKSGMNKTRGGAGRGLVAFTLIELLIVIAIMGILASLTFPVIQGVNRAKVNSRARAEIKNVESYIDGYKTKLGHYPPSDPNNDPAANTLFFELMGTRVQGGGYVTLDDSGSVSNSALAGLFGASIGGFINSTRGAGDDNSPSAQKFIKQLRPGSYVINTTYFPPALNPNAFLGVALDGPLMYPDANGNKINPFRYNSANPTNNPQSYDLWIDVRVGGKTNRISNWNTEPIKL
jgi:prepilin-type N-terminal cleavage/methylation domain-containing protein